ncbi:hypothetical protein [Ruegeria sp. HKCCD5849]|uniref:hypothetical protein n=1 Tax=unclassified Ruegeria TaxID=2625375 RepID=UPI00352FF083
MRTPYFRERSQLQAWYENLIANHHQEASQKVEELLNETEQDENGCWVTPTVEPRKLRLRGEQDRAYRFVYCITHRLAATRDQVIRHRCHNRRCINPRHLTIGDRRDNLQDERDRQANGVDWGLL